MAMRPSDLVVFTSDRNEHHFPGDFTFHRNANNGDCTVTDPNPERPYDAVVARFNWDHVVGVVEGSLRGVTVALDGQ